MQIKSIFRSQAGSVLLWTIGMVMVSLIGVNLALSVTRAVRIQSQLQAATDVAVLQAANQLNVEKFYQTGNLADVQIDSGSARFVVRKALADENPDFLIADLQIDTSRVSLKTKYRSYLWDLGGNRLSINFHAISRIEIYSD